jgi:hypothetical protein
MASALIKPYFFNEVVRLSASLLFMNRTPPLSETFVLLDEKFQIAGTENSARKSSIS